ncbi:extracellular solute-binding protein [Amedibacillus sp. YH-ame6]
MKKIVIFLLILASLLTFDVVKSEQGSIIIYSSLEQYRTEELQKQLSTRFPSEDILVMYVSTAKAAAKVKVEKENSDADIIVGLETSYLEKVKDSLQDLSGIKEQNYLPDLTMGKHDNKYLTWERQAGAFIVNKEVLKKYNLPAPKTYDDLLDPKYKNLISMPDPKTSGTGYFFYKSLVNERGDEGALAYFDKLEKNIKSFTESGSGPVKLLIQGEVAVGLGLTFQAMNEINNGSPFEVVFPPEGSPYSLTGTAMIKGKDSEKVREIFDFITNDFFIYDKENFSPEQVLVKQKNNIKNYPTDIPYANMDGIQKISEKERLLSKWKY